MSATLSTDTVAPAGTWTLDPVHSSASFAVKHMVVATFRGSFERVRRHAHGRRRRRRRASPARVQADSIVVKDENLAGHLKSPEFFDVERTPEITYVSTAVTPRAATSSSSTAP